MPTEIRKRSNEADVKRYPDIDPVEMSFDVLEWLEGERLEHEKRMRELGCPYESEEEASEPWGKRHLNKSR